MEGIIGTGLGITKWTGSEVKTRKKMMPRKVFDKAFKIAAVKLILEEGQSVKMVSSTLEIRGSSKSFISLDSRRRKIWRKSVPKTGERSSSCPI
nr:hypothetical protein [Streptococcus troglodytae]